MDKEAVEKRITLTAKIWIDNGGDAEGFWDANDKIHQRILELEYIKANPTMESVTEEEKDERQHHHQRIT